MSPVRVGGRSEVVGLAVVVVNYNYAEFVGTAVQSALSLDPPPTCVVVVDDGSTDGSLEVLHALGDRVRVVAKPNGGQLSACLAGLDVVDSDYVLFLDADDWLLPGAMATITAGLVDAPVKAQFQMRAVDVGGTPTGSVFPTYPNGYDVAAMVQDNARAGFYVCPPTSGNVYRCDTLRGLGLDELDQRDFIDGPATLVLPHVGEVSSTNTPVVNYRIHGRNHSGVDKPSAVLLEHEMTWFTDRWRQACGLMGWAAPPFGTRVPSYLLERRLMVAALAGPVPPRLVLGYLRGMLGTHLPGRHKLLLSAWGLSFLVPSAPVRARAVMVRRSPGARRRTRREPASRTSS